MTELETDAELVTASVETPALFGAIFDRHYDEIRAYVWRRLDPDVAEEVAAETFARAFAERQRFDPQYESARPWLFGIATNLLRMHLRSERRRLHAYARSPRDDSEDFASNATDRASAASMRKELLDGLARLSRRDREIVLLVAWAELTSAEVGAALGIPDATVRTRLARARKKLATGLVALREDEPAAEVLPATGVEQ